MVTTRWRSGRLAVIRVICRTETGVLHHVRLLVSMLAHPWTTRQGHWRVGGFRSFTVKRKGEGECQRVDMFYRRS